jgi:hypothetical protein
MNKKMVIAVMAISQFFSVGLKCPGADEAGAGPVQPGVTAGDVKIGFQGKVVDESDKPVEGAFVYAHIVSSGQDKKVKRTTVRTDGNGLFRLKGTGQWVEIKTIRKEGYALAKGRDNKLSYDWGLLSEGKLGSDGSVPVVFHLDKSDTPTIIEGLHTFVFWPAKIREYKIDLTKIGLPRPKRRRPERNIWQKRPPDHWVTEAKEAAAKKSESQYDLKVTGRLSADKSAYELEFVSVGEDSGIIASDEYLREAPADGYAASATVKVELRMGDSLASEVCGHGVSSKHAGSNKQFLE